MRLPIHYIRAFLFVLGYILIQPLVLAQSTMTPAAWEEDIRFLQTTVHQDYPFLFKKVSKTHFDNEVTQLIDEIPKLEDHELKVGIGRLVSLFEYGHTDISFRQGVAPFHKLPINLYHFNDGVFIEGTHKDHAVALGAKVVAIAGTPIKEVMARVRPVIPAENEQYAKGFGLNYMIIPEVLHSQGVTPELQSNIAMTLEKEGRTFEYSFAAVGDDSFKTRYSLMPNDDTWISARNQDQTPLYLKNLDKVYYYEYLPEQKAVYVRHSQIANDPTVSVESFYNDVFEFIENNDVEKLVLDVRLNGGGNNYLNKPFIQGLIKAEKINKEGQLFVIIGRRTFSACQNLINEIDNYTNAIFVGEPSAENINFYGDTRTVILPNSGIHTYLSFAWWQDKPQWENADASVPHLAADMSFEQYRSNQDPVLEAALNFDGKDLIIDPMGYLTSLFMNGQLDKVTSEARRMAKDPAYRFVDFEKNFNTAGLNMLGGPNKEGAIMVLALNTELYPESPQAMFSLAKAFEITKDQEKAKLFYNKAYALQPNGALGQAAKAAIEKMSE